MGNNFEGQVVLVTGGSRGIGRSICEEFAREGAIVYVNYSSNKASADEVVSKCQSFGNNAEALQFNVANSEEVSKAVEYIISKSGKIDVLINNAGISRDGLFVRFKDEDWNELMSINLNGSFFCARAVSKYMMKQKSGRIINMSSVVGEMGNAGQVPYVASKSAIIGFTKGLARELASRGITVNAIAPGFIETDMTHGLTEDRKKDVLSSIPLNRYGAPEEVAHLATFLASRQAAYITGQVIGINGGMYM